MKVLLIGLGKWGQNHLRTLKELGVDVIVCDVDKSKNPDTTNFMNVINDVSIVDIVTSADNHYSICQYCIDRGKDIFVEKPITMNSDEAREIIDCVNGNGTIFQVGHIYRYHPVTTKIKEIIDSGELGSIRYAYCHFTGFKRPRTDVGVTQTDAIHFYDLFNYLYGELPDAVSATVKGYLNLPLDDTSISTLYYGEKVVLIEAGYMLPEERRDITIVGNKGSVYCDFRNNSVKIFGNEHQIRDGKCVAVEGNKKEIIVIGDQPLTTELKAFLNSVKTRVLPVSNAQTGYEAMRIVDACYESSRLGKKIEIEW